MKSEILLFGLFLALITIGCSKDKETTDDSTVTAEEAGINAKVDTQNNDVHNIVENQYDNIDSNTLSYKNAASQENYFSPCAIITRVPDFGVVLTIGQTVTKTIDFGTIGCTMSNGNILKGKIILSFVYNPNAPIQTINCSFDNFYHNLRKIEGTKTFTRTMSMATAASPSHPIWVMHMNLTIILPDGRIITRVGTRTSEIIAGYNTPNWTDNVYSVTGNWTTTFPNTVTQTSTITSPIIIKLACTPTNSALSKGVISFVRNSHIATLDYGNGDCDNLAVFTINGVSHTIALGN
ncbi:hypothetical protein RYR30_000667 [Flavobacterium psychrophilum]|uniref:hypothetical protein n=1 Tax=Flavobacterium psychrophilum TaxID=96345 RepID=UPI001C8F56F9|nr:hypothetical protein [Flavobacterium psychrophilum]EKT4498302.1 hypothetical protein [Flavobacterium psychrophilum]ELM3649203.1 hypothetical protein [Flavobacterium psychrophilum]ELM3670737.1 hypothetical protein [Flavobacterium psychrophilum]ELM3724763.1 hypothetical protein [Flavobacterium psychrophilum]QZK98738.1 hypothetical protein K5L05_03355 [Flavobacterium psychrophilum]